MPCIDPGERRGICERQSSVTVPQLLGQHEHVVCGHWGGRIHRDGVSVFRESGRVASKQVGDCEGHRVAGVPCNSDGERVAGVKGGNVESIGVVQIAVVGPVVIDDCGRGEGRTQRDA